MVSGEVWGNSASISESTFKSTTSWSGNHASFSLSGSNDGYNKTLSGLNIKKNTTYTINWTVNTDCTIKVTKVSVKAGSSKTSCKIQVSGGNQVSIAWSTGTSTASNLSLGNNQSITFSATNSACVYQITVEYTITPNAPSIKATTKTIDVSLTDENTADMTTLITVSDVSDFMPVVFESSSFNDPLDSKHTTGAGNFTGQYFYATQAGVYTYTNPYVAAKTNCHEKSSSANGSITITVNRVSPTFNVTNGSVDVTTVASNPTTIKLADLITYSGNGTISYKLTSGTSVSGKDCTSSGIIKDGEFYATTAGTYTFTASAPQTAQYTATESKTFTVTVNRVDGQVISWSTSATTFVEGDAITASGATGATVTLSATGDWAKYVSIEGNEATITEVDETGSKEVTLTANATATDIYNATSAEKAITITSKNKQTITWNQSFDQLLIGGDAITLDAEATLGACTYTSSNPAVVSVSESTLTIVGEGEATLTASNAGNDEYAAVSMDKYVLVSDPTKVCPTSSTLLSDEKLIKNTYVDYDVKTPKQLTFKTKKYNWMVAATIYGFQYINGEAVELFEFTGSTSYEEKTFDLDIRADKIRIQTDANYGYYIDDISYTRNTYTEPSVTELNFTTSPNTAAAPQSFTVDYSNVKAFLSVSANSHYTLSHSVIGACGDYGTETITVNYTAPATTGSDNDVLYFKDVAGNTVAQVSLNAEVTMLSQSINNHSIANAYNTTDQITLSATATSGLTNFVYTATPSGVATFGGENGNVMTFVKSCDNLSITITQPGNATYEPCDSTISNITVSKVTPTITTKPHATNAITYGQKLVEAGLDEGIAKVKLHGDSTEIAGTWDWTEKDSVKTANNGVAKEYEVTFTPSDGGMYNVAKCSVQVTINQAQQPISWTQTIASPQTYRDTLELNASTAAPDGSITYSCDPDKATVDGNKLYFNKGICDNITVTASAVATADYLANTASKSFAIVRRNPVVTKSEFAVSYLVDDANLDLQTIWTTDGDGAVTYSKVSFAPTGDKNEGATEPAITDNRYLSLRQAGTLVIGMSVAQGANYNAMTQVTKTITINKYTNSLTVNGETAYITSIGYGAGENLTLATNHPVNEAPIIIQQTDGQESATYYNGDTSIGSEETSITDLSQAQAIYASHIGGTASWTLKQKETYKYAEASATIQATVEAQSTTCNVYEHADEIEFGWAENDLKYTWTDVNSAGTLSFEARHMTAGTSQLIRIDQQIEGEWVTVTTFNDLSTSYASKSCTLDSRATGVLFHGGGTLTNYAKNIVVTRKTHLTAPSEVTLPIAPSGKSSQSTVNLAWSTCADTIYVVGSNLHFTVSPAKFAANGAGNQDITITYSPEAEGQETSTITFYTPYEEIYLIATGEAKGKLATSIVWNGKTDMYYSSADSIVNNPFIVKDENGDVVANAIVKYTSSKPSVVEVDSINNKYSFYVKHCGGDVVLTASYAGDGSTYQAASGSFNIQIEKCEQTITWDQTFYKESKPDSSLAPITLNASVQDQGGAITYSLPENDIAYLNPNNVLNFKNGGHGSVKLTATAIATDSFAVKTVSKTILVRYPDDKCNTIILDTASTSISLDEDAYTIYKITAPADMLYFTAENEEGWWGLVKGDLVVQYSTSASGDDWTDFNPQPEITTSSSEYSCTMDSTTKRIRFINNGSYTSKFSSVQVLQASYISPSISSFNGIDNSGENFLVSIDSTYVFTIDYSSVPNLTISHKANSGVTVTPDLDHTTTCEEYGTIHVGISIDTKKVLSTKKPKIDTIVIQDATGTHIDTIPIRINVISSGTCYIFNEESKWSELKSWFKGDTTQLNYIPDSTSIIQVNNNLLIDTIATAYRLVVNTGGSVTITPTGGFSVFAGGVSGLNVNTFRIQSDTLHQGYFRQSPFASTSMPKATVEYATKGTLDHGANKDAQWQYFGVPTTVNNYKVDYITWLYYWNEQASWESYKDDKTHTLEPWKGYAITQYGQPTYEWQGQLINGDKKITLTKTADGMNGQNMIANSYSAPIDVKKFTEEDFAGGDSIDGTFYIFNSGSWNQWKQATDSGTYGKLKGTTPGSFRAIPILSAKYLDQSIDQTLIAPMQGICIVAKKDKAWVNFNYEKHVWNASAAVKSQMNDPIRVPNRDLEDEIAAMDEDVEADTLVQRVRIAVYGENSGADYMYLMEKPSYTAGYDNGYDALRMEGNSGLTGIYANSSFGQAAVAATNEADSMFIGFQSGEDASYQLFITSIIGEPMYLLDTKTQQTIRMDQNRTFTFSATPNTRDDFRFRIIKRSPEEMTGWEDVVEEDMDARMWTARQVLYIADASAQARVYIYSVNGQLMTTQAFAHNVAISIHNLPAGCYMAKVGNTIYKFVKW